MNATNFFDIISYHLSEHSDPRSEVVCEARVKVKVEGEIRHEVSNGCGPVNALDGALRKALMPRFPKLRSVHLIGYLVQVLDPKAAGSAAETRVVMQFKVKEQNFETEGTHESIIKASLDALSQGMNLALGMV